MRCTICGRTTLPGAKLCLQCKKALKRARQETVSELEPLRRRAPTPSGAREGDRGGPEIRPLRVRLGGRGSPSRLGFPASLVALGVVVVTTGYFVSHLRGAGGALEAPANESAPSQQTLTGGAYVPLPVMPLPTREPTPAADALPVPLHDTVPPATAKPAGARTAKAVPARSDLPPATEPSIAATQPDPAPPPQPEAAPAPAAPDRWQLLSEAVARCAGEGVLAGVICEQRARWQYCDGYWGKVAQCPGAMTSDFPH
jgi:hypothetical protein